MNAAQAEAIRVNWVKPHDICSRHNWCFYYHRPNVCSPSVCRLLDIDRAVVAEFHAQPEGNFKDALGRYLYERNMRG